MGGWMDGWVDGWMDGWVGVKAGLRIAYSNQQLKSDDQENKIKTTLIINYLFYLHNN